MSRGQLALDASPATVPTAAVSIVAASGDLDEAAAVRLLRWCETRLHLLDIGHGQIDHLVLDVSHARRATASAVAILDHARTEADRRRVRIHLAGAGPMMAMSSPQIGRILMRWSSFPTLDAALAALEPPGGRGIHPTSRPVDPDAIVLPASQVLFAEAERAAEHPHHCACDALRGSKPGSGGGAKPARSGQTFGS